MVNVKIVPCPLCGHAIHNGNGKGYQKFSGIKINVEFYPSGFADRNGKPAFKETFSFEREICEPCSKQLKNSLEKTILFIQEREIGR